MTAPHMKRYLVKHKRIDSYVSRSDAYPGTRYLTNNRDKATRFDTRSDAEAARREYAESFTDSYTIEEDTDA